MHDHRTAAKINLSPIQIPVPIISPTHVQFVIKSSTGVLKSLNKVLQIL